MNGQTSTIYQGNLAAADLQKAVLIDTFDANEKGTMSFIVTVPAELNNEYALKDSDVTWIFSSDEIIPENTTNNNPDNQTSNKPDTSNPSNTNQSNDSPKTGDTNNMAVLLAIFISSAAGLMVTLLLPVWRKRKEGKTCETD